MEKSNNLDRSTEQHNSYTKKEIFISYLILASK